MSQPSAESDVRRLQVDDPVLYDALSLADAMDRKKSDQCIAIDVRNDTPLYDFVLIGGAFSFVQIQALKNEAEKHMRELGYKRKNSRESDKNNPWVVLDFGVIILHLFFVETREFYGVDKMWPNSDKIYTARDENIVTPVVSSRFDSIPSS